MDIIRQLEMHSLQLMDEYYSDHHQEGIDRILASAAGEGQEDQQPLDTEERLFEF